MKKRVNIYISEDTSKRLKAYAEEKHSSVSQIITDWIWHARVGKRKPQNENGTAKLRNLNYRKRLQGLYYKEKIQRQKSIFRKHPVR